MECLIFKGFSENESLIFGIGIARHNCVHILELKGNSRNDSDGQCHF